MARHIDGLYLITKEYEQNKNVEDCYHRLAGLCDAIMKIDDFPFDLDQFTVDEKGKFINKFIEILESDKPYIKNIWEAKAGKKLPNKKICYTLKKEDVDNTLDSLMKAFIRFGYEYYGNKSFIPNLNLCSREELTRIMAEESSGYRWEIRHTNDFPKIRFEKCYKSYMNYFNSFIGSMVEHRRLGFHNLLENLYVLYKALYSFADIYFQSVLYLLIDNPSINKADKIIKMQLLVKHAEELETTFAPCTDKAEKNNIFDSFAVYIMYLDYRNTCRNVIEIQEILSLQMENESYVAVVDEEYQCNERWINEIETKKELRRIILEGKVEKEERFNKNMEDVQHLMILLNSITGRELGAEYLQHVKVVYREIIEDTLKYNNKQSRTIMRNIENKEIPYFDSERESYFIREKISRGFMREKGYSEEYILKNKLQKSFYNTVLKLFSSYDEVRIAKDARRLYGKYARELLNVLE